MRKIAAADKTAWAVISQCARLSPAADDQASLVDYEAIAARIASELLDPEPTVVDLSWVTKSPKLPGAVTDFPELNTKNV